MFPRTNRSGDFLTFEGLLFHETTTYALNLFFVHSRYIFH